MLEVKGLTHRFGDKTVLRNVDFSIETGVILGVMGASGGGKTTLLKCISGLLKPSEGDVMVNGISVIQEPEKAREDTGLVFQYAALFDFLNVKDNILFGLRRRPSHSRRSEADIAKTLLAEVGLEGTEHLLPSELSGGMRKRVGLARALALTPKTLLYDEPTSGLDPITAYHIDLLIKKTGKEHNATSVVVSHDVNSVLRTADIIAFLEKGELVFFGAPHEFRTAEVPAIRELVSKATAQSLVDLT